MKTLHFLILMFSVLFMDVLLQTAVPGIFWLAPSALIAAQVSRHKVLNSGLYYVFFALIIDVFSGLPFGFATIILLAVWITMQITERWLKFGSESVFMICVLSLLFLAEFLLFMMIPLEVHDTLRFALKFLIVSLAPISVVAGIMT